MIPTKYMGKILREAENKEEIKQQIRDTIDEVISNHTPCNNIVEIRAQDDNMKVENLFFTMKFTEWKSVKGDDHVTWNTTS